MGKIKMKIIDNFLPAKELKLVQDTIFHRDFSWKLPPSDATCHLGTNEQDFIYFNHFFYKNYAETCKLYSPLIIPILKRLGCVAPIGVKALIFFNKLFDECVWHRDHQHEATTAILYLNTCNGGTQFKIGNEIKFVKAEENKVVIFPSQTDHRPCTSTDVDLRFVLNFNFFE